LLEKRGDEGESVLLLNWFGEVVAKQSSTSFWAQWCLGSAVDKAGIYFIYIF
jgi:hypothetical protein